MPRQPRSIKNRRHTVHLSQIAGLEQDGLLPWIAQIQRSPECITPDHLQTRRKCSCISDRRADPRRLGIVRARIVLIVRHHAHELQKIEHPITSDVVQLRSPVVAMVRVFVACGCIAAERAVDSGHIDAEGCRADYGVDVGRGPFAWCDDGV